MTSITMYGQSNISSITPLGGDDIDGLSKVRPTADGGYLAIGDTRSGMSGDITIPGLGSMDAWVVKFDANKVIQWQKVFGGSSLDDFEDFVETPDGGYIMTGLSTSTNGDITGANGEADVFIVKLDSQGNKEWSKVYGGSGDESGRDIVLSGDGGYYCLAATDSSDGDVAGNANGDPANVWLFKIDGMGNIQWQETYGGSQADNARDVVVDSNGDIVVLGLTSSFDGDLSGLTRIGLIDAWLIKVDPGDQSIISQQVYGNPNYYTLPNDIAIDAQDNIFVFGMTVFYDYYYYDYNELCEGWVIKIGPLGNQQWQKLIGGAMEDEISAGYLAPDGSILACGHTLSSDGDIPTPNQGSSDGLLLNLNPDGSIRWIETLGGSAYDDIFSVCTSGSNIVIVGRTNSNDGDITEPNNGLGDAFIEIGMDALLSIELSEFTGQQFENSTQLNWTTISELNNRGFEIQRKTGLDKYWFCNW